MRRLFLGLEPVLPSLEHPQGRCLKESDRHLTLAFLGNKEENEVIQLLQSSLQPPFKISPLARADRIVFLSNVAALEVLFLTQLQQITRLKQHLMTLFSLEDPRPWMPHITLCKEPMDKRSWQELNISLPCTFKALHLYESLGNSQYHTLWSMHIPPAFQSISHTADYAFIIYGYGFSSLYLHACFAICVEFPMLFPTVKPCEYHNLDEVIDGLNHWIALYDIGHGSPIKAVSYHGAAHDHQGVLVWEMILDV